MTARRRRRSRLLGLLLLVVLLEGALQLAAPLVRWAMTRPDRLADPGADVTVLCVGDSNTYGLHMPRVLAYPALLEQELERRYRGGATVVNRGIPGQNAFQVAEGLRQDLADVDPDLVLLLAGINDTWNAAGHGGGPLRWLNRLRLVRLARVLVAGVTSSGTFAIATDEAGEIVVDRGRGARRVNAGEGSAGTLAGAELAETVRRGLGRALAVVRDDGAVPVLMTYAESEGPFATVNEAIRSLAIDADVLLVDHGRDFRGVFDQGRYDELMFDDHHPNGRGYLRMARGVVAALDGAGLLPPRAARAGGASEGRGEEPAVPPVLRVDASGTLQLSGPPGWAWQLLVSCVPPAGQTVGFEAGPVRIPLAVDEALALSRLEPTFSGRFGADGRAAVPVPPALRREAGCPLRACLLLLRDTGLDADPAASAVAAASPAVPLPRVGAGG